jgi:hypothetical protein
MHISFQRKNSNCNSNMHVSDQGSICPWHIPIITARTHDQLKTKFHFLAAFFITAARCASQQHSITLGVVPATDFKTKVFVQILHAAVVSSGLRIGSSRCLRTRESAELTFEIAKAALVKSQFML